MSPRTIAHPYLDSLSLAHVDCDAYYASVEKRDNPDLQHLPVIVGGGTRGVVSTCCYVARTFGVHSAMPMFKALKACPDAIVIKPNMSKYVEISRQIRHLMDELTPIVEPLSLDEAFLDLSGTQTLHGIPTAETLLKFQKRVADDIGITISVGLSDRKYLAKMASDLQKPNGFSILSHHEAKEFLKDKSVRKLPGIGPQFAKKLEKNNIRTIGDLQNLGLEKLERDYGKTGANLHSLSIGEDARRISNQRPVKSVSNETTFHEDIIEFELLKKKLWKLSRKVADRLKAKDIAGTTITLKLKDKNFKSITRSKTFSDPLQSHAAIFAEAINLLEPEMSAKKAYRLIGVGISQLKSLDDFSLFRYSDERIEKQEAAIDVLRAKFGDNIIKTGNDEL